MKRPALFLLVLIVTSCVSLPAQNTPAPADMTITLGNSVVALTGPWKFQIGDNPQWSDPNFNDASWETVSLGAPENSLDPSTGFKGFVPGWTAKGHPGYSGFAWYRIKIRIRGADAPLSLLAPISVDDSYQVFANGRLLGSFGNFDRPTPTFYFTRPLMFALATAQEHDSPEQNMVLAFRFYMSPATVLQAQSGGMHTPPVVGLTGTITAAWHVAWEETYRSISAALVCGLTSLSFALLVLMLYAFDRSEKILLWLLGACALEGVLYLLAFFTAFTQWLTGPQNSTVTGVLSVLAFGFWLMTWRAYFGLQSKKWIRTAIVALVLWTFATGLLIQSLILRGTVAPSLFVTLSINRFVVNIADLLLVALIAFFGLRKPHRGSPMLFLALFFYAMQDLQPVFDRFHVRTRWFPFGMIVPLSLILSLATLFCLSIVLIQRFRASQRRQQAVAEDIKQAQEVQQVLIPEELPHVPGLSIQSEYRPAREVGGDFFQIIPHSTDGSVLVVAGDVTGKGLQAGMLVALIVGVIRNQADASFDPLQMLDAINARLCGRSNAATCLAMRIAADGSVTLANAGHLPPWLNGKELPVEGAVPLGLVPGADFPLTRFQLRPDDSLMVISDGIVEAQNEQGHLFGFDRVRQMLAKPVTAAEIAAAAQTFGQQDDISILSITFSPALEEATA